MNQRAVMVTGMGFCLPGERSNLHTTKEQVWDTLRHGYSWIKADENGNFQGFIPEDAPVETLIDGIPEKYLSRYSPLQKYALASLSEAVRDSGLERQALRGEKVGLLSAVATTETIYQALRTFADLDLEAATPAEVRQAYNVMSLSAGRNDVSNVLSDYLGMMGGAFSLSCGCASSAVALGLAIDKIRSGEYDICVVNGADYYSPELLQQAIEFKHALLGGQPEQDNQTRFGSVMRPYDEHCEGVLFGNGACTLILESHEHAQQRGANVYGELVAQRLARGREATALGLDETGEQITRAIRSACAGHVAPDELDYVNGGAQGDKLFNKLENTALKDVFGAKLAQTCVTSQEACYGHAGGLMGNLGVAATLLMMKHSFICPTANCEQVDPVCEFNPLPNGKGEARAIRHAVSLNYQAAGIASALLMRAPGSA